jgi:hypothetical protein
MQVIRWDWANTGFKAIKLAEKIVVIDRTNNFMLKTPKQLFN